MSNWGSSEEWIEDEDKNLISEATLDGYRVVAIVAPPESIVGSSDFEDTADFIVMDEHNAVLAFNRDFVDYMLHESAVNMTLGAFGFGVVVGQYLTEALNKMKEVK